MTEQERRTELIAHAEPEVREQALALADELTQTMHVRDIELELAQYYTRKKAREIVQALKFFDVVFLKAKPGALPFKERR